MQTDKDITLVKYKSEAKEIHITGGGRIQAVLHFHKFKLSRKKDPHGSALPEALYIPFTLQHLSEYKSAVLTTPVLIKCDDILAK